MLTLDKTFPLVSSTAFGHMGCYNQHKMEIPQKGFKNTGINVTKMNKFYKN